MDQLQTEPKEEIEDLSALELGWKATEVVFRVCGRFQMLTLSWGH